MASRRGYYATVLLAVVISSDFMKVTWGVTRVDIAHHSHHRTIRSTKEDTENQGTLLGLGPGEDLQPSGVEEHTPQGTELVRLTETFKGVPVSGESVVLELDHAGKPTGRIHGRLVTGIQEDLPSVVPELDEDDALQRALAATGDSIQDIKFDPKKDMKMQVYVGGTGNGLKARLTYKLSYRMETERRVARPTFIIDANSGDIVKKWDGISLATLRRYSYQRGLGRQTRKTKKMVSGVGGNTKVGRHIYGSGTLPALKVTLLPSGLCALENDLTEVYNCKGSYDCEPADMLPHQFNCSQGSQDAINGAYSPLNDAFFNIGKTSGMFRDWYNVSDIFLQESPVKARVHYGEQFDNAFWDGETIAFGDGGDDLFPMTSINMVAHEMAHGFTEVRSGLDNFGQSGAINEAFSDMAGEVAEFFTKNTTDWKISFEAAKAPNKALRYFKNPPEDGFSIGHYSDYCFGMESHAISGIFNRAFYILSTKENWDIQKAFNVFLSANSLYWHPESQFHEAACDTITAAHDLEYSTDDLIHAFQEVGIEPCSEAETKRLPGPVTVPAGYTMIFEIVTHGIAVDELHFVVDSYEPIGMKVDTGGLEFEIKSPHGYLPRTFTLPTILHCLGKPCTVTLIAEVDSSLSIFPMAHAKTIVSKDSLENDKTLLKTFTIPEQAVKSAVRLVFRAKVAPGGGLLYYIRHGGEPDVTSHRFDVMGTTEQDAVLCNPGNGTYYIKVVPLVYSDLPVTDINIGLYTSFNAILKTEKKTEEE